MSSLSAPHIKVFPETTDAPSRPRIMPKSGEYRPVHPSSRPTHMVFAVTAKFTHPSNRMWQESSSLWASFPLR